MSIKKKNSISPLIFIVPIIIGICFMHAIKDVESNHLAVDKTHLEDTLRKASAACYAAEGVYPPDIEYLEEHYGISINKELYDVKYEIFASNLMPDITVLDVDYEK